MKRQRTNFFLRLDIVSLLNHHDDASQYFHPQHQVLSVMAQTLLPLMRRSTDELINKSAILEKKTIIASNYLAALDVVEDGISRNRAKAIFELVDSKAIIGLQSIEEIEGILPFC